MKQQRQHFLVVKLSRILITSKCPSQFGASNNLLKMLPSLHLFGYFLAYVATVVLDHKTLARNFESNHQQENSLFDTSKVHGSFLGSQKYKSSFI
jgi:hypothetical protein